MYNESLRRYWQQLLGNSLNLAITFGALYPKMAICIPVVVDALTDFGPAQPADMCLANSTPA